jgi:AraC-like DNA-binding protein
MLRSSIEAIQRTIALSKFSLARAFTRVLRLTPSEYRSRFCSSGIGK